MMTTAPTSQISRFMMGEPCLRVMDWCKASLRNSG